MLSDMKTMTTTLTECNGEIIHSTSETGDKITIVSAERAEEIIAARKAQGWSAWRETRTADGALLDCLLTISI